MGVPNSRGCQIPYDTGTERDSPIPSDEDAKFSRLVHGLIRILRPGNEAGVHMNN